MPQTSILGKSCCILSFILESTKSEEPRKKYFDPWFSLSTLDKDKKKSVPAIFSLIGRARIFAATITPIPSGTNISACFKAFLNKESFSATTIEWGFAHAKYFP